MPKGTSKDVAKIIKSLEAQGWKVRKTGSGHYFCTPPEGEQVTVSGTASDHRALANIRADLKKRGWQG